MADGKPDAARVALAKAISDRDAAAERLESAKAALDRISDQLFEAQRRLHEARAAAVDERAALVRQIVAGGSATVLERANGEAAIEAELEALRAAQELTRAEWRESDTTLDFAERKAKNAALAVMAGAAPGLLKEVAAARERFVGLASVLRFLRWALPDGARLQVDMATSYPTEFDGGSPIPMLEVWKACAEALSQDSDAKLPE